jgi:hypothetical protein
MASQKDVRFQNLPFHSQGRGKEKDVIVFQNSPFGETF